MAEILHLRKTERGKGLRDRARALDTGLSWLRPVDRQGALSPRGWSHLDLELADLHARFERACIED